jgi:cell division protein FtsB
MLEVAAAVLLYVAGFPCLYGVMRLAVRHGLQDVAQSRQENAEQARERARLEERTFARENAFLTGS